MALDGFAKKLVRTVARVIPQCGMVSQAVAFNMFLVFFPSLLFALGLMSRFLNGKNGQDLAARLTTILPPGSWQLISDYVLRRGVNPWTWVVLGWLGSLLVGLQVMKLMMEGIRLIYGENQKHSFLIRQLRGLLLFSVSIVAWVAAVALSVFGRPLRQWMIREFGTSQLVRGFVTVILPLLAMILAMLVLALIFRLALQHSSTWRSILPGAAAATILWWVVNLLFGAYVRKMHYGPVYGGLAAVFGLMVWMEFSVMIVFLGAAWNAESSKLNTVSNCEQTFRNSE
jgi:membrane protein